MKKTTTRVSKKSSLIPGESRSIYDEYFEYDQQYKTRYGDKTCVLLEVGSFFEIYTYKIISTNTVQHPQTQEISRICNLSLVEKKASYKNDNQQIMMMGFRNYMLDKYLQKLVDVDYTIVVYVQEKNGKEVTRVLDAVYSKGTFIRYDEDETSDEINNVSSQMRYIVCMWIEIIPSVRKKRHTNGTTIQPTSGQSKILYGISAINIFTGHSVIFEYETPYVLNPTTFDEMERFLSTFSPSEIIIISNTIDKSTIQTILRFSGVHCNTIHIFSKDYLSNEQVSQPSTWKSAKTASAATDGTSIITKIRNCEKQNYIQLILANYYDNANIYYQHHEFQRNPIATQSFCYLLDFIKEHNINLIRKIAVPTFTNTSDRMVLANHTLRQLNIINDNSADGSSGAGSLSSVLSFMNRCGTAIGRRLFQRKLLNPTFDSEWLEAEYAKIDNVLKSYKAEEIIEIRKKITCIRDIEKIYRQIVSRKIYPSVIYQLYNSIDILNSLQAFFKETSGDRCPFLVVNHSTEITNSPSNFNDFLNNQLYIDICRDTSTIQVFDNNIIQPGISNEIDKLLLKKIEYSNQMNAIFDYFNCLIRSSPNIKDKNNTGSSNLTEYIRIHETEKSGFSFQITATRAVILKKILAEKINDTLIIPFCGSGGSGVGGSGGEIAIPVKDIRIVSASSSSNEIQSPFFSILSSNILKTDEKLNSEISKTYMSIIERIEVEWSPAISEYIEYIGYMDLIITKAFLAREYSYCRPVISKENKYEKNGRDENSERGRAREDDEEKEQTTQTKSFLKATKMRHCLIEHLQTNEIYIPNDVSLGIDGEDGILLFGTNAIGKTSLIRSIGVCVILAQAGLYVPCETFVYNPYSALFSRIIGNDNLFKNLSTFQVEISELSVILKHADNNSLILGDEICSSTELESGLSIIMASLIEFHNKQASFIFATHFHDIVRWEEMKRLTNIKIKHLEVSFDPSTGKLKYDRKLKDGIGITSYGLTVCQSMNLPTEFLDRAFEIRNRHYPEKSGILSLSQSKYNSKKIIGICEECKTEFSTEIHHIEPQKNADSIGMIRTVDGNIFHKNHLANLKALCEECHKKTHYNI